MINTERSYKGHVALLTANLIFGLNTPISKTVLGLDAISPYALTMFRMIGAAIIFWCASAFVRKERVARKDLVMLFFASLLGIQLNQTMFLIGLSKTSPIDASIVVTLVPILTMIISAMYLKEPITWKKVVGVLIGASGALLLILSSRSSAGASSGNMVGNMLCLLSAASFATYLTVFKPLIVKYRPVTLMKWMFLYAAVCSIPFGYKEIAFIDYSALTLDNYVRIGYVVLFATFIAYILIPIGQQNLRPTVVSMYNYLQPLVSSVVAVLMGMDIFGWEKALAGVLVFLGVYVVTRSKSRAQLEAERLKVK